MSAEAFTATEQTSEQNVGDQQEELESHMEYGSDLEQIQDNEGPPGADDTLDQSAATNADIRPPQHRPQEDVATGGTGTKDSLESPVSGGGSGSESQQARSGSDAVTQQGGDIDTESHQGGVRVAVSRKLSHESSNSTTGSGAESQKGSGNGTESQLPGAVGGNNSQDSQGSATDGSSGNGTELQVPGAVGDASSQNSQGSATDGGSGNGTELQLPGAVGGTSNQDSQGSATDGSSGNGTELQVPGAVGGISSRDSQGNATDGGSSNGNSFKTAAAFGSSVQDSLESGVAGDVSNSPDTLENSAGTESVASASAPRIFFWKNIEERSLENAELTRSYEQCFNKCACICDYMRPCSIWIRRSKIFMFLKTLLLAIPISAFFMGLNNLSGCPAAGELPILMMLMGVAGVILIMSSLGLDSRRALCPSAPAIYFRALILTTRLMFVGLFATGLDRTYAMSPSFDSSDHDKYCDEAFYNYAYYTNFVVIGIVVLSFFIYVPSFDQNIEGYAHL